MKSIRLILFFLSFSITGFAQKDHLDYFVTHAIDNSPLLKDYANQIQSSAYDSLLILAAYKPQFTGNGLANYAPVVKGWGYDAAITNGQNLNALIAVTQQLPNKKTLKSQFENLQLQNQSLANSSKISVQELTRNIIAQYISVRSEFRRQL